MRKFILLILPILFPVILFAQDMEQNYKIYDTRKASLIRLDELIKNASSADVLFFGEEHNDSTTHFLELCILEGLHRAHQKTALSMEMFTTDVQPVIDEYLSGCISEKNFIKDARAWNNYNDYRPMIEFAKTQKISVIGANAATRYSNMVSRGGLETLNNLPQTSRSFLPPLPIDTAAGRYHEKFNEMLGGHPMGNMKVYQAQNLWDATMAWAIIKYLKKNKGAKVLQVNGRFHSDEKLGTAAKLQSLDPRLKIANISCFSAEDFDHPNWDKHKDLGDYVIITNPNLKKTF